MAASGLNMLLLLALVALSPAQSLHICSAPASQVVDGTPCERTLEACPRCLAHDPLLDTIVCTNVDSDGNDCVRGYVLCTAMTLATTPDVSNPVGQPLPWNTTDPSAQPSVQPSVQPPIATTAPTKSPVAFDTSESPPPFPIGTILIVAAAIAGAASVLYGVLYNSQRLAYSWEEATTRALRPRPQKKRPRTDRDVTVRHDRSGSYLPKASTPIRSVEYKPSTAPTLTLSELAISRDRDSYLRRASGLPDMDASTADSAAWVVQSNSSRGVDATAPKQTARLSRNDVLNDAAIYLLSLRPARKTPSRAHRRLRTDRAHDHLGPSPSIDRCASIADVDDLYRVLKKLGTSRR